MEQGRREQVSRERDLAQAARELSRVAEDLRRVVEITEAQREAAERSISEFWHYQELVQERLAEGYSPLQRIERLSEEAVAQFAEEAVRQVREEIAHERGPVDMLPPPDTEEIKEWEKRREERRRREGYSGV